MRWVGVNRHSRQLAWTTAVAAAAALLCPAAAYADPPPLEEMEMAFFHVSVAGAPVDGAATTIREGKAFAIGPNLIITSRHIVGDEEDWRLRSDLDPAVARATTAVDRTIELVPSAQGIATDLGANALISAEAGSAVDIAEVSVPDARLEHYFGLSMCDIRVGETYTALLGAHRPPIEPASVKRAAEVKLRAAGYDVPNYGGLFVFDVEEDHPFVRWETDGHEGSPIFDEDGKVVGIVSAVTLTGAGDHRILSTPIQLPLLSAISTIDQGSAPGDRDRSIKCSLASTVKRINDQVLAYASWRPDVPRDKDRLPAGQLLLRYESVADYANIESVDIEYDFWGKQRGDEETPTTRLWYPDDDPNRLRLKGVGNEKMFDASDIIREAKGQLEAYLNEEGEGGVIQYVEIRIVRTKLAGTDLGGKRKPITLTFDWRQP